MRSVLMVVPRMLYPAVSGGEVRVSSLMRFLASRARFTVLTFLERDREVDQAAAALKMERDWGIPTVFARRRRPVGDWTTPEIARHFADAEMSETLARAARGCAADLIHLEFTQMAHYAPEASRLAPVVLTEHDASILSLGSSYVRSGSFWGRLAERLRHEAYLRRAFGSCARVVTVSAADAARLSRLSRRPIFRVVPTGVDLARFPFAGLEGREPGLLVFVGHYPHFPNEDAAVHLCRDIMPALRRLRPSARAALVGSCPTSAVTALAGESVEVVGRVPEVGPRLRRARVFIAPMRLGYGIKGKILEAFASGTPVVATPQSCEAMPGVEDGRHVLLGRDAESLAAAAERILSDDALARSLAAAARDYVVERFGWERQAELLARVYDEAAGESR